MRWLGGSLDCWRAVDSVGTTHWIVAWWVGWVVHKKPEATKTLFLPCRKLIGGGKTWWRLKERNIDPAHRVKRNIELAHQVKRNIDPAHWQFWQSHPRLDGLRPLMRQGEGSEQYHAIL